MKLGASRRVGFAILSMAALLAMPRSGLAIQSVTTLNGSDQLVFGSVTQSLSSAYALVVMHGNIGTGYYLDNPASLGIAAGTGGILSLGSVATGSDSYTLNFQYASNETPVGVIVAGVYTQDANDPLSLGVNTTFAANNPAYNDPSLPFSDSPTTSTESESSIQTNINTSNPGGDNFLNAMADLPLNSAAFISFAPNSPGDLVDFPVADGQSNGNLIINPTAAAPLPAPLAAGLIGFAALAILKRIGKSQVNA